jgi:cytidylate kinase
VSIDKLTRALSNKPSIFEKLSLEKKHYITFVQNELLKAVKDENVVYHGLAGHLLLRRLPHVLRVKVVANLEFRIKAAMDRNKLDQKEAIRYIKKVDKERDMWVKSLYHVERNDPAIYDLVINLDRIKLSSAIGVVVSLAMEEEFLQTEESKKRINDLILANNIKAKKYQMVNFK